VIDMTRTEQELRELFENYGSTRDALFFLARKIDELKG